MTAIERADGARQHGDRLHASARDAEASAFARLASRPLQGLGAVAGLYRVEATYQELSLSEREVSAVRDRIDDPVTLARALHEAERRWPRHGPEYEDDPDLLGSVQAAGAQREALAMPLRLVPRSSSPYPWRLVPHHATALAAALKRWADESRRGSRRRRGGGDPTPQRQQKIGEDE